MSRRIDKSWLVFNSVENAERDRCVDFFSRPDGTFGFEEFRRDPEDQGYWTPVAYRAGFAFIIAYDAYDAAVLEVRWLGDVLTRNPSLRRMSGRG